MSCFKSTQWHSTPTSYYDGHCCLCIRTQCGHIERKIVYATIGISYG